MLDIRPAAIVAKGLVTQGRVEYPVAVGVARSLPHSVIDIVICHKRWRDAHRREQFVLAMIEPPLLVAGESGVERRVHRAEGIDERLFVSHLVGIEETVPGRVGPKGKTGKSLAFGQLTQDLVSRERRIQSAGQGYRWLDRPAKRVARGPLEQTSCGIHILFVAAEANRWNSMRIVPAVGPLASGFEINDRALGYPAGIAVPPALFVAEIGDKTVRQLDRIEFVGDAASEQDAWDRRDYGALSVVGEVEGRGRPRTSRQPQAALRRHHDRCVMSCQPPVSVIAPSRHCGAIKLGVARTRGAEQLGNIVAIVDPPIKQNPPAARQGSRSPSGNRSTEAVCRKVKESGPVPPENTRGKACKQAQRSSDFAV